ncbi:unextended protein-like [Pectinophora gossypiella]|uniref:unextended protein-like n=1 Tax=Pectinophora gossypiella TaxID=13191 RepID=UPI00214EEDEA|nr:unextended protein-like [Pectinophora gossypiella]
MATACCLRTSGVFLLLFLLKSSCGSPPWILSVRVSETACKDNNCALKFDVNGEFDQWSLTHIPAVRGSLCSQFVPVIENKIELISKEKLFFCAKNANGWFHQGERLYLEPDDVTGWTVRTPEDEESEQNAPLYSKQMIKSPETTGNSIESLEDDDNLTFFGDDLTVNYNGGQKQDGGDIETFSPATAKIEKYQLQEQDTSYKITGLNDEFKFNIDNDLDFKSRSKRQADETPGETTDTAPIDGAVSDTSAPREGAVSNTSVPTVATKPIVYSRIRLMGLRVEEADKEPKIVDGAIPSVLRETNFIMRLFGEGFTNDTVIAFTHFSQPYGHACTHLLEDEYHVKYAEENSALLDMKAPPPIKDYKFYICVKNSSSDVEFIHQGSEEWKILATHNKLLPLWVSIILIIILLVLASLFSGLNLGLMALDRTELKIIANTGTEKERKYARAIMPVRSHGNYLLCTILLSNVAVNSTFTVILDDLTSGLVAVIGSTLAIVFIAEITPQAICARHGLLIGAKSIWIMKIVMGICAPLAWPTSKLLDYFLGEEIGTHYNRERLKELVKVTNHVNDLDKEEVNIISGALDLRKKSVKEVMTKLKDCFMLPIDSVLDFETMTEIVKSGYSRIPVYEGHRGNIITVLFIKDLAFVDPDDNTPLRTLCQYYQNPCNFVFEDVTLDVMLKQFKEGHKGHMAFVQRIDREGDGDPVYETVGLVTLEDVIEEMIQAEIVDETDVISDNRTKKRLPRPINKFQDLASFAGHQHQRVHVSPQLVLATFQFLSASVDAFRPEVISETVLRRLLKQDVIQHIKLRGDEAKDDPKRYVFQEGKPVDYFVLILEGRVEVTVGRENLVFEAGPFTYFGVQALTQNVGLAESPAPSTLGSLQNLNMDSMLRHTFVPDYSVRAIAELYYLTIKRSMYLAAKRATLMEKGALNKGGTNEQIEPEVDKLLREGDYRVDNIKEEAPPKPFLPSSASPLTNSTFKSDKDEHPNPEEERLLKK